MTQDMDEDIKNQGSLVPPTPPTYIGPAMEAGMRLWYVVRGLHVAMYLILAITAGPYTILMISSIRSDTTQRVCEWVFLGISLAYLWGAFKHILEFDLQRRSRPGRRGLALRLPWIMIAISLTGAIALKVTNAENILIVLVLIPMPPYFILAIISTVLLYRVRTLFQQPPG